MSVPPGGFSKKFQKIHASFLLLISSLLAAFCFQAFKLPAAWLFGPLVVSALFAIRGWKSITFSKSIFCLAQAIIGTALGEGFSGESLQLILSNLGVVTIIIFIILFAALLNGWILVRWTQLDIPTAFLGTLPGGASAMIAMSPRLQADVQLVAILQYIRLLILFAVLFIVASISLHFYPQASESVHSLFIHRTLTGYQVGMLTLITVLGCLTGIYTNIPAGTFLIPVLLEFVLGLAGISVGRWPAPIFMAAYLVMGLQVGGRFQKKTLELMRGLFIPIVSTTLLLLCISLFLAAWLTLHLKMTALDAYLATTPGGLDSVAAMAGELKADSSIILVIQTARLLSVLIFGPWLIQKCIQWMSAKK